MNFVDGLSREANRRIYIETTVHARLGARIHIRLSVIDGIYKTLFLALYSEIAQ